MAWDGWKSGLSFLLGVLLLYLGLVPLLQQFAVISVGLPAFISGVLPSAFAYLLAVGGLYLLIDAYEEWGEWYFWATAIVGLAALTAGVLVVLNGFGVIPFTVPFMTPMVYNVVFVIEGVLLMCGAFLQL